MLGQITGSWHWAEYTSTYLTKLLNILTYQELIWKRVHMERTLLLGREKINPARQKIYIFIYIYVYMRITWIEYGPLSFHHNNKGTNLDTMVQSTQHIACIYIETTLFQLYFSKLPSHNQLTNWAQSNSWILSSIKNWSGSVFTWIGPFC